MSYSPLKVGRFTKKGSNSLFSSSHRGRTGHPRENRRNMCLIFFDGLSNKSVQIGNKNKNSKNGPFLVVFVWNCSIEQFQTKRIKKGQVLATSFFSQFLLFVWIEHRKILDTCFHTFLAGAWLAQGSHLKIADFRIFQRKCSILKGNNSQMRKPILMFLDSNRK
jgi:hypothetical protein